MSFTFVHASDLHLDSPLRGLERYEGAPAEEIRGATRRAFDNLIELAARERAKLVVLAGDVYDGDWRDYNTGLFFASRLARLRDEGIPVVLIRGNHDAASRISRALRLPPDVHDLPTDRPTTVRFEEIGVAVHGQGYSTQEVTNDLAASYPAPLPGLLNVGLLHTSIDGREGHAPYAPTSLGALLAKGYDYWALGHVHQREVVHRDPWVVFSGNVQGRHARELGPKGCTLVRVERGRVVAAEHRELDVIRWTRAEVDASGAASDEDLLARVHTALGEQASAAAGRLVACRVLVRGPTRLHARIAADPERWTSEVRALAGSIAGGRVWVEKIRFDTRAEVDVEALRARQDPLGDLLRWLSVLPGDDAALQDLAGEIADLRKKLPRALLDEEGGALALEGAAAIRELLPDVEQLLIPLLLEAGRPGAEGSE